MFQTKDLPAHFSNLWGRVSSSRIGVGILKFVVATAVMLVTKYILEAIRYSDNLMYSFKTLKEYNEVKADLQESFNRYSMSLKNCITAQKYDEKVLEHPNTGAETIEKTMGLLWSVTEDTITAIPRYNLFGSSRGKELGPSLKDMTE